MGVYTKRNSLIWFAYVILLVPWSYQVCPGVVWSSYIQVRLVTLEGQVADNSRVYLTSPALTSGDKCGRETGW